MDWRRQQEQQTHNNNNGRGGTRRMRPLVDEQGGGGAAVGGGRLPGGGGGGGGQQQQQQHQQRAGTTARTRGSDEDDGGSERWKRVKVDGRESGLLGNWELDFYRDRAAWEVGNSQLGEGRATTMAVGMMGGGGGQVVREDSAGRSREVERFSGGVGRGQELERRGGGGSRRMRSPEEVVLQHESERDESSRHKRLKQEEGLGNGGSGRGREMGFASERDRENGRDLRMRDYERRGPHLERDGFRGGGGGGERTVFRPPPPRLNREGDSRERGGGEFQRDRSKIREKERVGGGEPRNGEQKKKMEQPAAAAAAAAAAAPPPPAKERRGEEQARKYQLEVLEQAKVKNTIAFLETGAGKTLIAVLLMKHKYETMRQQNQRMLAVFLVPKVPLVYQVKYNSLFFFKERRSSSL